jgi:hypothetical protein
MPLGHHQDTFFLRGTSPPQKKKVGGVKNRVKKQKICAKLFLRRSQGKLILILKKRLFYARPCPRHTTQLS